jgi:hypothetical protein
VLVAGGCRVVVRRGASNALEQFEDVAVCEDLRRDIRPVSATRLIGRMLFQSGYLHHLKGGRWPTL